MDLIRKRVSAGLPDNFPTQQKKERLFLQSNLFNFIFKTTQLIIVEWGSNLASQ